MAPTKVTGTEIWIWVCGTPSHILPTVGLETPHTALAGLWKDSQSGNHESWVFLKASLLLKSHPAGPSLSMRTYLASFLQWHFLRFVLLMIKGCVEEKGHWFDLLHSWIFRLFAKKLLRLSQMKNEEGYLKGSGQFKE